MADKSKSDKDDSRPPPRETDDPPPLRDITKDIPYTSEVLGEH